MVSKGAVYLTFNTSATMYQREHGTTRQLSFRAANWFRSVLPKELAIAESGRQISNHTLSIVKVCYFVKSLLGCNENCM